MQILLQAIAERAKESRKYRFRNLYTMLNQANLEDSWRFMNRKAAPGVDRETAKDYEQDFAMNIADLVLRLKEKRYKAKLVKRVNIPKGDGKLRPLGLPAIEDKLLQVAVTRILSAIFEEDFQKNSYGYRPNLGAQDAVRDITRDLQFGRYEYIVEADIKGYFDNIDHDWLLTMLEQRIDDKAFVHLIRKWLKAGILDAGKIIHPVTGTPQGGVVSPILANIYLHFVLDVWFEKVVKKHCRFKAVMWRYADDFICAFEHAEDADRFFKALSKRLKKFTLSLADDKSKIIPFSPANVKRDCFDFLGFEFSWGKSRAGKPRLKRRTSRKKFKQSLRTFTEWIKKNRYLRARIIFEKLNSKLRGYYNYYGVIGNSRSLNEFSFHVRKTLFKWLNRRSQRRSYTWEVFRRVIDYYQMIKPHTVEKWSWST